MSDPARKSSSSSPSEQSHARETGSPSASGEKDDIDAWSQRTLDPELGLGENGDQAQNIQAQDGGHPSRTKEENDSPSGGEESPSKKVDPTLVQWDGPDDPLNPRNWAKGRKWTVAVCVSCFTLISPIASSIVAPGLPAIAEELHITEPIEQNLVLSIFVAAYTLGPLFWSPMSELYGRSIIMQVSNLWFLLFNLGCGLARNKGQMLALRFLAGIGGSAPMSIGAGVVGDLFVAEERGGAMGIYSLAPVLGPALGPLTGGWVAERTTWRWVFYATTIACGVVQTAGLFFLQETYAPVLLGRKRARLVKETGNAALHTEFDAPGRTPAQMLKVALTRPFRLLVTQPIVQILSLYMMFIYGLIYLVTATYSDLWATKYHESTGVQGLNYISIGLGFILGSQVSSLLQDRIYAALKRRYVPEGGPGRPEFRVPVLVPSAILLPVGLLIYSWTAEMHTHWIAPNIGAVIFSTALMAAYLCISSYTVDTYTVYAASAVGVMAVLRSLAGFAFPLFAPIMYDHLGYGKGGSVLAACAVAVGWPSPILLWYYGPKLRAASKFAS